MKLKKLTLFGFKSFADKTEILFDEGVTCVVGPNGCGKSNISDSIRWVLGERSAKMLRGASMEDVIFNGTEFRKPLNFAEVSLTIDNTDKTLPLEYAEVTITRRLYRSGESEYLINKTACRLKDVQDLILDTGIGTRQYSMIEQGKIDHLLRAEPEERRTLIEEAAGIAKFKTKKDEALRKLQRTEENLLRLNDIVGEVEKNIKYAERQAKKAEKYKLEFDHLKNLEIERVFLAQKGLAAKKGILQAQQTDLSERLAGLEKSHHEWRSEIGALETLVTEIQNRFQIRELGRYQKASQSEKNEQQLQFIGDKKMETAQQRGELLQEQDHLQETLRKSSEKKEQLAQELREASAHLPELHMRIQDADAQLGSIDSKITLLKQDLEKARVHFFDRSRESAATRNQIERSRAFLDHFSEQQQRFQTEQNRLRQSLESNLLSIQQTESTGLQKQEELHAESGSLQAAESNLQQAEETLKSKMLLLDKAKLAVGELEAKIEILENLQEEDTLAFSRFENEILEFTGLYTKLSDFVSIESGYERIFDASLRSFAHLLLVQQPDALRRILQSLKQRGKSPEIAAFFLANNLNQHRETPAILATYGFSPLLNHITIDPAHRAPLESLLQATLVCDELPLDSLAEWFPAAQNWTIISRDGLIIEANGLVSAFQSGRTAQFAASRKQELLTIQNKKSTFQVEIQVAAQDIADMEKQCEASEANLSQVRHRKTGLAYQIEASHRDLSQLQQARESLLQQEKIIASDFDDWLRRAEETRSQQNAASHALAQLESAEHEFQNQLRHLETELEVEQKNKEQCLVNRREILSRYESGKQREHHIKEALLMVQSHEKLDQDRLIFLEEGKKRLSERDLELRGEEQQCIQLRGVFERELQELGIEIELIRQEKTTQESRLAGIRQRLDSCNSEIKSLQETQHTLGMQMKDYDFEEKSFIERVEQKYRLVFSDLARPETLAHQDLAVLDEEIVDLQKRVDQLGTVNLLAIEEYEELKQRFDFMGGQKKDLEDAREQLLEAIRKINRTTKELFEETFRNVQRQFGEYYKILFNGGEAKLVLLDEQHPLDSGVDIVVRPPGKKLQHISLLSGGEKALTAVALLFALFSIKPSPFCLLDEVDAPLDEANVDRFLKVTQSFIKLSQFIIITHNRKTISVGNALYGITMQEAGVSKVVSVRVASDLPDLTPAKKAPSAGTVPV